MNSVPKLDLAPKLDRPLRLWWPPDYLRLFYWVFFFPQAIRWYLATYGTELPPTDTSDTSLRGRWTRLYTFLITPTTQRNLFFQGQLLQLIATPLVSYSLFGLLSLAGIPVDWNGVAFGVAGGVAFGVAVGVAGGVAVGVAFGVAFGVAGGVAFGVAFGVAVGVAGGVAVGVAFGVAGGVAVGVAGGVAVGVAGGVAFGVAFGVAVGVAGGVAVGVAGGVVEGDLSFLLVLIQSLLGGLFISGGVSLFLGLRLPDWFLTRLMLRSSWFTLAKTSRMTWLPLPSLTHQLQNWLETDEEASLQQANLLLAFTLQFISVIQAVNQWLTQLPESTLLISANRLATRPFDWDLVQFSSASLSNKLWHEAIDAFFILPRFVRRRWLVRFDTALRFDTPVRSACAGYYLLHRQDTEKAVEAFDKVRSLPHGNTLYRSVLAIHQARQLEEVGAIAQWADEMAWLSRVEAEPLRPAALATLTQLHHVALEAQVAVQSISKLNRSAALGRAGAILTTLINTGHETCPELEWPLIKEIAEKWRDGLALAGGEIGELAITKPVANPFIVGPPVQGNVFVGREATFRELEGLWGSDPRRGISSIVLYGHRRMGKTSILQNLGIRFGRQTQVVYFTMQQAGRVGSTGELLNYLALAIYDPLHDAGYLATPEPDLTAFETAPYHAFNRFVATLKPLFDEKRLILSIDEFELIEQAIDDGRIDVELLDYLRSLIQTERWFILALAGLHTLREMTEDYWNPLFAGVTPVRVGLLTRPATAELLANPHDDFPFDFTQDTVSAVYDYVRGQPYLTQLIGHSLVRHYNEHVFEHGKKRSARFTPEDVTAIVSNPMFYEQGSYYFSGVWRQAEQGESSEIPLLKALAISSAPLPEATLFEQAGITLEQGKAGLAQLQQHDVVLIEAGLVDFTVPLMRRWVRGL